MGVYEVTEFDELSARAENRVARLILHLIQ